MSCTPPWRCMGANDVAASRLSSPPPLVRPISPSTFAAALQVLAAARDEADSEQVVQVWIDRMHPELAVSTASMIARTRTTDTTTIASGAWETASGGTMPNKSKLAQAPPRLQHTNTLRRTRRQNGRAESQQPSNVDKNGDGGDDEEAHVRLASPRLTTHHLLTGCHRSLPAEIIPLDLDLPLPPQDHDNDDDESALDGPSCCPRHSRGARIDRLHIALLDYLRLPTHRWPGRWRGRRYKERTWMSSFDGAAEADTTNTAGTAGTDDTNEIMGTLGTDTF